jgi:hypothetical protein
MGISRAAKDMGYPLASPRDARWTKPLQLLPAASEAGVRLLACPLWSKLVNAEGKLPKELEPLDMDSLVRELSQTPKGIGSF